VHIHTSRRDPYSSKALEGLKVIDVGCGGGILSEVELFSLSIIPVNHYLPSLNIVKAKRAMFFL